MARSIPKANDGVRSLSIGTIAQGDKPEAPSLQDSVEDKEESAD